MSDSIMAAIVCIVGVVTLNILVWRINQKLKRLRVFCNLAKEGSCLGKTSKH